MTIFSRCAPIHLLGLVPISARISSFRRLPTHNQFTQPKLSQVAELWHLEEFLAACSSAL